MKLEEVLPAMRAGRVARRGDSDNRYRINGDTLEVYDTVHKRWRPSSLALVEGWTLEPEPKVEWPKGSLGWAITEAGTLDCEVRIRGIPLAQFSGKVTVDDAISLDWEVVP